MLNTSDFTQRLQQVMDYYGMNATAFADALEIQRGFHICYRNATNQVWILY